MTKRVKVAALPSFDAARYLDDDRAVAAYLTDVLAANNPALLAGALGTVARARGMSEIARRSGLTREALYRALRPDAQPRFDTVRRDNLRHYRRIATWSARSPRWRIPA